ncbi:MAG TPA: PIN domain-containing protein [Thermoanaerobaculia bacterium]|jgi:predicted nucleic acid-binding protein|nr:PIN domain-containing protein [Thermoanaerobaculia bacterium]
MKSGRYLHYFDTCIFLHWLSDPQKDVAVVDGIEDIVLSAERQQSVIIVTSVITRIEILNARLAPDASERFNRMLGQFIVQTVNVDPRIALLAHDIRDYYMSQTPAVKLETPDCIHLATAIHFECDEMNTLDGGGLRKRPGDLLTLSENVMGGKYTIPIKKPLRKSSPSPQEPPNPPLFRLFDAHTDTKQDDEKT